VRFSIFFSRKVIGVPAQPGASGTTEQKDQT
jgi:hypothetical protein